MYNAHRGMVQQPPARLTELLDQVRQEFDSATARGGEWENQVNAQMQEMELIRQKLFTLEQQHMNIKQRYEEENTRLRHELELRGPGPNHAGPSQNAPANLQPPNLGTGPGGLFQNIMTNPPGHAPPPEHQQGPPQHTLQQHPPGPQHSQQPFYNQAPPNGSYNQGPSMQPTSPGAAIKRGPPRGPPGPNTPVQPPAQSYPERGSPQIARPTPPPGVARHPPPPDTGNNLADLELSQVPPYFKHEGEDWHAIFNQSVNRQLDIELMHTLAHDSVVCCVRFSQDGKFVATGCNRSAQIFEVVTGRQVTSLTDDNVDKEGDLYIRSVCFSPDGKYLATGAEDKLIRVWEISTRTIKQTFQGHEQDIYSLDFARNGRHIASGSGDRTVRVWDIETGREILSLAIEDGVTTVAMSPNGEYVAAGSLDKSVRVWDTRQGTLVQRLDGDNGHRDSVYSVAFSPDGEKLVSGSLDKTIKLWDLTNRRSDHQPGRAASCIRTFEGHRDFVLSVALTPDGNWVLSGSKDRGVQFWDPNTGIAQLMLQGHKNSVISVSPSPQITAGGGVFATGSGDMRARIWQYKPWRG